MHVETSVRQWGWRVLVLLLLGLGDMTIYGETIFCHTVYTTVNVTLISLGVLGHCGPIVLPIMTYFTY